jgi:hypothetical protein
VRAVVGTARLGVPAFGTQVFPPSRPVTPRRSAMTEDSVTADDSSSFSARFFSRVRSSDKSRR